MLAFLFSVFRIRSFLPDHAQGKESKDAARFILICYQLNHHVLIYCAELLLLTTRTRRELISLLNNSIIFIHFISLRQRNVAASHFLQFRFKAAVSSNFHISYVMPTREHWRHVVDFSVAITKNCFK